MRSFIRMDDCRIDEEYRIMTSPTSFASPTSPPHPQEPESEPDSDSTAQPDLQAATDASSHVIAPASEDPHDLAPAATTAEDLLVIRDLLLKAYSDVVPDMVIGDSTASLLASIERAREAYAQVLARIEANSIPIRSEGSSPPAIPAGGGLPLPIDPDRLPASEKIRRGLSSGRRLS
jgi:hypothetical protein